MKKICILLLIVIALIQIGCDNQNRQNEITGLWQLHIMEIKDTTTGKWSEWRNGMQGYLLYDNKDNVALHLMPKGYEKNEAKFRNFTDTMSLDKLQHLSMNYNYMGKYEIDPTKQVVSHKRLSHSNPNDWGVTVKRKFSFNGDTLIIRPAEAKNARLRLKWLKK